MARTAAGTRVESRTASAGGRTAGGGGGRTAGGGGRTSSGGSPIVGGEPLEDIVRRAERNQRILGPNPRPRKIRDIGDIYLEMERLGVRGERSGGIGGFFKNIGRGAAEIITGLPAAVHFVGRGIYGGAAGAYGQLGRLPGHDLPGEGAARRESDRIWREHVVAGRAIADDFAYRYGPLFKGDFGRFGSRVYEQPLAFALDAAAGYGTVGRAPALAARGARAASGGRVSSPRVFAERGIERRRDIPSGVARLEATRSPEFRTRPGRLRDIPPAIFKDDPLTAGNVARGPNRLYSRNILTAAVQRELDRLDLPRTVGAGPVADILPFLSPESAFTRAGRRRGRAEGLRLEEQARQSVIDETEEFVRLQRQIERSPLRGRFRRDRVAEAALYLLRTNKIDERRRLADGTPVPLSAQLERVIEFFEDGKRRAEAEGLTTANVEKELLEPLRGLRERPELLDRSQHPEDFRALLEASESLLDRSAEEMRLAYPDSPSIQSGAAANLFERIVFGNQQRVRTSVVDPDDTELAALAAREQELLEQIRGVTEPASRSEPFRAYQRAVRTYGAGVRAAARGRRDRARRLIASAREQLDSLEATTGARLGGRRARGDAEVQIPGQARRQTPEEALALADDLEAQARQIDELAAEEIELLGRIVDETDTETGVQRPRSARDSVIRERLAREGRDVGDEEPSDTPPPFRETSAASQEELLGESARTIRERRGDPQRRVTRDRDEAQIRADIAAEIARVADRSNIENAGRAIAEAAEHDIALLRAIEDQVQDALDDLPAGATNAAALRAKGDAVSAAIEEAHQFRLSFADPDLRRQMLERGELLEGTPIRNRAALREALLERDQLQEQATAIRRAAENPAGADKPDIAFLMDEFEAVPDNQTIRADLESVLDALPQVMTGARTIHSARQHRRRAARRKGGATGPAETVRPTAGQRAKYRTNFGDGDRRPRGAGITRPQRDDTFEVPRRDDVPDPSPPTGRPSVSEAGAELVDGIAQMRAWVVDERLAERYRRTGNALSPLRASTSRQRRAIGEMIDEALEKVAEPSQRAALEGLRKALERRLPTNAHVWHAESYLRRFSETVDSGAPRTPIYGPSRLADGDVRLPDLDLDVARELAGPAATRVSEFTTDHAIAAALARTDPDGIVYPDAVKQAADELDLDVSHHQFKTPRPREGDSIDGAAGQIPRDRPDLDELDPIERAKTQEPVSSPWREDRERLTPTERALAIIGDAELEQKAAAERLLRPDEIQELNDDIVRTAHDLGYARASFGGTPREAIELYRELLQIRAQKKKARENAKLDWTTPAPVELAMGRVPQSHAVMEVEARIDRLRLEQAKLRDRQNQMVEEASRGTGRVDEAEWESLMAGIEQMDRQLAQLTDHRNQVVNTEAIEMFGDFQRTPARFESTAPIQGQEPNKRAGRFRDRRGRNSFTMEPIRENRGTLLTTANVSISSRLPLVQRVRAIMAMQHPHMAFNILENEALRWADDQLDDLGRLIPGRAEGDIYRLSSVSEANRAQLDDLFVPVNLKRFAEAMKRTADQEDGVWPAQGAFEAAYNGRRNVRRRVEEADPEGAISIEDAQRRVAAGDWREGDVVLVSRGFLEEFQDPIRAARSSAPEKIVDDVLGLWKAGVLVFAPRWYVYNTVGNLTMYGIMNGADVRSILESTGVGRFVHPTRAGRERARVRHDVLKRNTPEAVSGGAQYFEAGLETAAGTLDRFLPIATRLFGFNKRLEGVIRRAAYLSSLKRQHRLSGAPEAFRTRMIASEARKRERLDGWVEAIEDAPLPLREEAIRESLKFLGDYTNYNTFERAFVKRVIPFWSWIRVISKLTWGLPFENPLRPEALRLLNEAAQANVEPEERLMEMMRPLWARGGIQIGPYTLRTNTLNPFATPLEGGPFNVRALSELGDPREALRESLVGSLQSSNPAIQLGIEQGVPGATVFLDRPVAAPPGYDGIIGGFGLTDQQFDPLTGRFAPVEGARVSPEDALLRSTFPILFSTGRQALAGRDRIYDTAGVFDLARYRLGLGGSREELFRAPFGDSPPISERVGPHGLGSFFGGLSGFPLERRNRESELEALAAQIEGAIERQEQTEGRRTRNRERLGIE